MAIFGEIEEEVRGITPEEDKAKETTWERPMTYDIFSVLMLVVFGIAVFFTITLLNSPLAELRQKAIINIGIAILFTYGFTLKVVGDNLKEVRYINNVEVLGEPLTSTRLDLFSAKGFLNTMLGFGIALGLNLAISTFLVRVPFSIFNLTLDALTFAIISSVSEEMFFLSMQDFLGSIMGVVTIPINVGVFALYHSFVYQSNLIALAYVSLGRLVYAIVYQLTKRPSTTMLAHLANNVIALLKI